MRTQADRSRVMLGLILALGIGARVACLDRAFDQRIRSAWQQADFVQVARNFSREGMNIFYPQIDWRRDGPGYVEIELPLQPWVAAALYRVFGYHVAILRALSALLEVASLLLFAWFARQLLPVPGALFATAAFAANPFLIYLASAMQPEPLMHLLALATVVLLWRWTRQPAAGWLFGAGAATAGAILAKPQGLCLLVLLAWTVGRAPRASRRGPVIVAAGLLACLPPLLWYAWVHRFWVVYGNSVGLSNEAHRIGIDLVFPPKFLVYNLAWDAVATFTPVGLLLAVAAWRSRDGAAAVAWPWYAAVWTVYVAAARTAIDPFGGVRYHSASIAPGCLLLGAGFEALRQGRWMLPRVSKRWPRAPLALLSTATLVGLLATTAAVVWVRDYRPGLADMYRCSREFLPYVPAAGRVVVGGGKPLDSKNLPIAHHQPVLFAWMDRKGFPYPSTEVSVALLDDIAARGGRWWVAAPGEIERLGVPDPTSLRYRRVAACTGGWTLVDLRPSDSAE